MFQEKMNCHPVKPNSTIPALLIHSLPPWVRMLIVMVLSGWLSRPMAGPTDLDDEGEKWVAKIILIKFHFSPCQYLSDIFSQICSDGLFAEGSLTCSIWTISPWATSLYMTTSKQFPPGQVPTWTTFALIYSNFPVRGVSWGAVEILGNNLGGIVFSYLPRANVGLDWNVTDLSFCTISNLVLCWGLLNF